MHSRKTVIASVLAASFALASALWDPGRACEEPHCELRAESARLGLSCRGGTRKPGGAKRRDGRRPA